MAVKRIKWLHTNPNPNKIEPLNLVAKAASSWSERQFILVGVASGLNYLQKDGVKCVLHRNIKSSNLMLEADLKPSLGDFGLVDKKTMHKTTVMTGPLVYMVPKMQTTLRNPRP